MLCYLSANEDLERIKWLWIEPLASQSEEITLFFYRYVSVCSLTRSRLADFFFSQQKERERDTNKTLRKINKIVINERENECKHEIILQKKQFSPWLRKDIGVVSEKGHVWILKRTFQILKGSFRILKIFQENIESISIMLANF